jgi:hypothetical protein
MALTPTPSGETAYFKEVPVCGIHCALYVLALTLHPRKRYSALKNQEYWQKKKRNKLYFDMIFSPQTNIQNGIYIMTAKLDHELTANRCSGDSPRESDA